MVNIPALRKYTEWVEEQEQLDLDRNSAARIRALAELFAGERL